MQLFPNRDTFHPFNSLKQSALFLSATLLLICSGSRSFLRGNSSSPSGSSSAWSISSLVSKLTNHSKDFWSLLIQMKSTCVWKQAQTRVTKQRACDDIIMTACSYFAQLHVAVFDVLAPGVAAAGTGLLPHTVPESNKQQLGYRGGSSQNRLWSLAELPLP